MRATLDPRADPAAGLPPQGDGSWAPTWFFGPPQAWSRAMRVGKARAALSSRRCLALLGALAAGGGASIAGLSGWALGLGAPAAALAAAVGATWGLLLALRAAEIAHGALGAEGARAARLYEESWIRAGLGAEDAWTLARKGEELSRGADQLACSELMWGLFCGLGDFVSDARGVESNPDRAPRRSELAAIAAIAACAAMAPFATGCRPSARTRQSSEGGPRSDALDAARERVALDACVAPAPASPPRRL